MSLWPPSPPINGVLLGEIPTLAARMRCVDQGENQLGSNLYFHCDRILSSNKIRRKDTLSLVLVNTILQPSLRGTMYIPKGLEREQPGRVQHNDLELREKRLG